ncbi:MAG: sulfite exporter TauE/SafE family protein [Propionibacteriales bacterium]|nr:sulfite exporter TauE/SafE family protein [Propionibacteriales bacterium]
MTVPELSVAAWTALVLAAAFVGFAKTAIGGVASLAVVIFAAVLPARESTGALLPLLICGDVIAVAIYRRHANWRLLVRLLPGVIPGLVLGALFVSWVDDATMRRAIAVTLLVMAAVQVRTRTRERRAATAASAPMSYRGSAAVGTVAGFSTMAANAAGPVMTLYLILAGLPALELLGTGAWFFLLVNLTKLPFSAGLDLLRMDTVALDVYLLPLLALGAWLGVVVIRRIEQAQFETAALWLSILAAGLLLV